MKKEFNWPCDMRIAHGPHPTHQSNMREGHVYKQLETQSFVECPGVSAHPETMIGRTPKE